MKKIKDIFELENFNGKRFLDCIEFLGLKTDDFAISFNKFKCKGKNYKCLVMSSDFKLNNETFVIEFKCNDEELKSDYDYIGSWFAKQITEDGKELTMMIGW